MSEGPKSYCGAKDVPKGRRRGNMKECSETGRVSYYGVKKIDARMLAVAKARKKRRPNKTALMKTVVTLRAQINKMRKEYDRDDFKTEDKKRDMKERINELITKYNAAATMLKNMTN